jgi:hypothetical protein
MSEADDLKRAQAHYARKRQSEIDDALAVLKKHGYATTTVERNAIIEACRVVCCAVGSEAHEAAKAKDATDYVAGYQDAAVDCNEALQELLTPQSQPQSTPEKE